MSNRSTGGDHSLRVAVLTGPFSATYDAQLTALRERTQATVEIVYQRPAPNAPFADDQFASLHGGLAWEKDIPTQRVQDLLDCLQPDVIVVTSWNYGAYMRLARSWKRRALRLMVMDNPWRGSLKQWAGLVASRVHIQPAIDVAFLPNERQRVFARKLGFAEDQIWYGVYGCDQPRFEADAGSASDRGRSFLFVGRLVRAKGVEILLEAYDAYRGQVELPWQLDVVGTGPLAPMVDRANGVNAEGFRQPSSMPSVFAAAGCFVLPSIFEPWGTVIHEATASGLPIICTTACGAWIDLVRDGYNGFLVPPANAQALTEAMLSITAMDDERRRTMAQASISLSRQLTPQRWADSFDERARIWLKRAALSGHQFDDAGRS